ncbi:hypothetical protein NLI96_g1104 [Meripilus lineatus]|uniref:G domain-containing protein n=1 Tax=Meripilus lineatus TaxID=2056292 RepID=A0AAD5VD47_9APHY|nr:hypothetical protein NLI96_g1104 [Physisporinus lineatus]
MSSNEVLIAVMGATGTGKSTFINLISGSKFNTGSSLMSCTQDVQSTSPFTCLGRRVTLIDTPGFDDSVRTDTEILEVIANHLSTAYRNNKKLNGVIYMHRISDVRMGGISRRNFRMFRDVCGDTTLNNVVVVTNMWGEVTPDLGRDRETQLATNPSLFKPVLDKGAKMNKRTKNEKNKGADTRKSFESKENRQKWKLARERRRDKENLRRLAEHMRQNLNANAPSRLR